MKKIAAILFFLWQVACYGQQCPVNFTLGNDTTVSCSSNFVIQATPGMTSYTWSNGATQQSVPVTQSGTYTCYANFLGSNLVVNGNFSAGNTNFTSGYVNGTGGSWGLLSNEGQYAVSNTTSAVHNNFVFCNDHTSGNSTGSMMIVNGAAIANVSIWSQTITVQPNTDYQFSFWGMTATIDNPGQLMLTINGSQVGNTLTLPSNTCNWQEFYSTWNSGSNTSVVLSITNQNTQASGNDFAIDDIMFRPVCTYSDQIVVTIPPKPVITVSNGTIICQGSNTQLTANSSTSNLTYTWTPGSIIGSSINVQPTTTTNYSVTGIDQNGCQSLPKNVIVTVNPKPIATITGDSIICFGASTTLTANSTLANSTYTWNGTNTNNTAIISSDSTVQLIVTTATGCKDTATIHVSELSELTTAITGNTMICATELTTLTAQSSAPGVTYIWSVNNASGNSVNVDFSNLGWVYVTSTHPTCGTWKDSILITQKNNPIVTAPADLLVCPGNQQTVQASSNEPNAQFFWQPGNLTGAQQSFNPTETTTYTVYAEYNGCVSALDTFTIHINLACTIEIPNVFTPNGDNSNDYFQLIGYDGIKSMHCTIINRWGNTIIEFDHPNFKWDGKDTRGDLVTDGTFFYLIEYTTLNDEEFVRQGFIQKKSN